MPPRPHDPLPRAGASADISTPSRTPSPPGRTATTKPATVARATLAITTGARPSAATASAPGRIEGPDHRELAQAEQDPTARGPEKTLAQEPAGDAREGIGPDSGNRKRDETRHPAEDRWQHDDQKRQGQRQARESRRFDRSGSSTRPQPQSVSSIVSEREPPANPTAATRPPAHIITSVS